MRFAHIKLIYLLGISAVFSSNTALTQSTSNFSWLLHPQPSTSRSPRKAASAAQTSYLVNPLPGYGNLPLAFEVNQGQISSDVKFLARRGGYTVFLTATDAVLKLKTGERQEPSFIRLKLADANEKLSVIGSDELPGKINYFIGKDHSQWHTNIPTYSKVRYAAVYPGIDLVYYGNDGRLEYDFVVSPGADPGAIHLAFNGADPAIADSAIDNKGDLVLRMGHDEVRLEKPVVYQQTEAHAGRQFVEGRYRLTADGEVTFQLGGYDKSRSLIIDPVLVYSTFLQGNLSDGSYRVFVDSSGSAYVTGGTESLNFPTTPGAFQTTFGGSGTGCTEEPVFQCGDAFVTKMNPTGSALIWSTYLGGSNPDAGFAITADSSGVYVAGQTSSSDFPVTAGAFQTTLPVSSTRGGFITKLNTSGSALVYSTYLAGSTTDKLRGLAVDSSGNAYVTGGTQSSDFPVTANAFQKTLAGASNAFVSKMNPTGTALAYSTFVGGTGSDAANSIAIDASGNAYITGGTISTDFPTKNPIQAAFAGGGGTCPANHASICGDGFVTELDPTGSTLIFSSYLGGSGEDSGVGLVLDSAGNIYVSGGTDSSNFPTTTGAFQTTFGGGSTGCTNAGEACGDAFLTKINAVKTAYVYSTYLGGTGDDVAGLGLAIDAAGNIHMAGITASPNFPTTPNAPQLTYGGGSTICSPGFICGDGFVTKFSLDGSTLNFSTFLGGSSDDGAGGVAQDTAGNDYVVGVTTSGNFPTTPGAFQTSCTFCDGQSHAFITKLAIPFPTASLSPLNVNFGNQVVGITSPPTPVTLTNSGTDNLLITSIVDANGFAQTNNCPIAPSFLAPTQSCTIDISFTPPATGPANDTLTITDDAAGSPQTIPLTGVGLPPGPIATLAPSPLNFTAAQLVGTTSAAQPVTLTNTGTTLLTISAIALTGPNANQFTLTSSTCGASLAAGASCTVNISYAPTAAATSAASISVTDNAPGSPQTVPITGTVQNFSLTSTCGSLTVVPGQTAIYAVDLAPVNGFTKSVSLSCSGAPSLANCTVSPSSITLDGSTTVQAQVTATTTPPTSGSLRSPFGQDHNRMLASAALASMMGLIAVVILPFKRRMKGRRFYGLILFLCMLSTMATLSSCGIGGGDPPGTAAGTYPLTVTGTYKSTTGTSFTQTVSFNLVVQ
jgi:Beta-propeller repeat/Abnormal spindle-like microcephaly-assoc'd, ASPM-SPD-2-Hydin